jgi:hypothetical protein
MLLKNSCFCTTHKSSVSTGFAEQIMPILHVSCCNGCLVTWTVVSLTTAKFKPLLALTAPPYNTFARTEEKTPFPSVPLLFHAYRCRGNMFIEPLPRNLAPKFLLWADMPQHKELHNLCTEWKYVAWRHRARWLSNNALRSYAGGTLFESRPEYQISWQFQWFSSVAPEKCWNSTSIKLIKLPLQCITQRYTTVRYWERR